MAPKANLHTLWPFTQSICSPLPWNDTCDSGRTCYCWGMLGRTRSLAQGGWALVTYPVLGPAFRRSWVLTCCRLALGGGCGGLSLASIVCCHLQVAVGRLSKSHAWKGCPVKARQPSMSGLRDVELRRLHGTSRPSSLVPKGSLRPGRDRLSQRGSKAGWAGFRAACLQQGCGAASCH